MIWDFAIPARIARCQTETEIINLTNMWNGKVPCYVSVNPYEIISIDEFNNIITKTNVKRFFFDIDNNDFVSAKKIIDYLLKEDLKFELFHSGSGYHIYIYCEENDCPRNMRIAQLSILYETQASVDMSSVGDLMRISRIPNTWNFKSKSFCIPIHIDELSLRGSEQRFEKIIYGNKKLDLSNYTEINYESIKPEIISNMNINTSISLIPCIKNIIKKVNPTQIERYCLVVYLSFAIRNGKDIRGFDMFTIAGEILKFFNINCSQWLDYNQTITKYQIENIIKKSNIIVGCKFLKDRGICIGCLPNGI